MTTFYNQGQYRFRVTNQGFGEAANEKKTPFFFLQGEPVVFFNTEGLEEPVTAYQRTIKMWLSDKTVDHVLDNLAKLGFEGRKFALLQLDHPSTHSFLGQEIVVECQHKAGQGDRQDELFENWQLPFEGGAPMESDSKVATKLDAMFGKKLAGRTNGSKPAPAPQAHEAVTTPPGDDIPF